MAMTDYFYDFNKITTTHISDATGGYKTVEADGDTFTGLAVQKSTTAQEIGALRGEERLKYNLHVLNSTNLSQGEKVKYTDTNGVVRKLVVIGAEILNTVRSAQTAWKTYPAEEYYSSADTDGNNG